MKRLRIRENSAFIGRICYIIITLFRIIVKDIRIEVWVSGINKINGIRRKIIADGTIVIKEIISVIVKTRNIFINRKLIAIVTYTFEITTISIRVYLI